MKSYDSIRTDVLIIGSGGAGLRAAIEAAKSKQDVIILSKEAFGHAHTEKAMGGINVAIKAPATPAQHFKDTYSGGWYVGNEILVDTFTREMPDRVHDLVSYGVNFDRLPDGSFYTWAGGKQTAPLNLCAGDYTGREMMQGLVSETQKQNVTIMADYYVTKLFAREGIVGGALAFNVHDGKFVFIQCKALILAAGGGGQLYKITSNEPSNTAEGYSMAFDIGAALVDMEFIQFHPTGMAYPMPVRGSLITEKVRGHKGKLYNSEGARFMSKYQPERMELAGRDEVARAIFNEVKEGRGTQHGGVYLDVTELSREDILKHIPEVYEKFHSVGVDISREKMEITPTMHHMMGGVKIDVQGKTNVAGFYACGEVTGGIHGANRLGGNSLAEGQVFGRRAGLAAAEFAAKTKGADIPKSDLTDEMKRVSRFEIPSNTISADKVRTSLKNAMWDHVGIVRTEKTITKAIEEIQALNGTAGKMRASTPAEMQTALETVEMVKVAHLIATAALARKESRGAHFRRDFPNMSNDWEKNIILTGNFGDIRVGIADTVKKSP